MEKYYIVAHDFTIDVNETPSAIDYRTYKEDVNAVEDWAVEEFDDGDKALEAFDRRYIQTHFEMEYWQDCERPGYTIYGTWYSVEDEYGHIEAVSDGAVTGDTIDEWKDDVMKMIADGIENKYFFFDDPHYTYCPKGW